MCFFEGKKRRNRYFSHQIRDKFIQFQEVRESK